MVVLTVTAGLPGVTRCSGCLMIAVNVVNAMAFAALELCNINANSR